MMRQPDPPDEAALRALTPERLAQAHAVAGAVTIFVDKAYIEGRNGSKSFTVTPLQVQGYTQALLATLADLRARLAAAEAHRAERWNVEPDGDNLRVCRNLHEKGEKCEYELYVPAAALAAMTAERDALRTDRDVALSACRVERRRADKAAAAVLQGDAIAVELEDIQAAYNREIRVRLTAEQQRDTARAALTKVREYVSALDIDDACRACWAEGGDEHDAKCPIGNALDAIDATLSAPEGRPDDAPGPECSICRRPGRHTHACE